MEQDDLDDARSAISAFLQGTGGEWDWDDFTSTPLKDDYLDAIRRVCLFLPNMFPPEADSGAYCNPEGLRALRAVRDILISSDSEK